MGRTETLKKAVKGRIAEVIEDVSTPDAVPGLDGGERNFPYATFEIQEFPEISHRIPVQLEVNLVDYGTNGALVDSIADDVQAAFDRYMYMDDDIQFIAYKGSRNIIRESDKLVMRRRLIFELSFYERRNM